MDCFLASDCAPKKNIGYLYIHNQYEQDRGIWGQNPDSNSSKQSLAQWQDEHDHIFLLY